MNIEKQYREALALFDAGQFDDSEAICRKILNKIPRHSPATHLLSGICAKRGDHETALRFIGETLSLDALSASAWNAQGSSLRALNRPDEALASYDRALEIAPAFPQAYFNRGQLLGELGRFSEALESYNRAIAHNPNYARALAGRGKILLTLKRFGEAAGSLARAAAIDPSFNSDYVMGLAAYGEVLFEVTRYDEALTCYERAVAIQPDFAKGHLRRGNILYVMGRLVDAQAAYEECAALPGHKGVAASLAHHVAQMLCDWRNRAKRIDELVQFVASDESVEPFSLLHTIESPALQLKAAQCRSHVLAPIAIPDLRAREDRRGGPIRLGYFSGDFRHHPVAYAMIELFEKHDRSRVEVYGIALSPSDGSQIRSRLEGAFDRFLTVDTKSDEDIANTIRENRIDILIDLMGYSGTARPGMFSYRPAPVAASYLGYPGTTGNEHFDYLIADRYVIPESAQRFYSERIAYLPDSFFISDSRRTGAAVKPARSEQGLPESGFVFCCFNQAYKITPEITDLWARLLSSIEKSVLWSNITQKDAVQNLKREFAARGIGSERLIFSPFVDRMEDHLARLSLADLFLDTFPYNAHSTACDALWAGVPVLTMSGDSFASRVAGSLLAASGLPELIVHSARDYEALAARLAREPNLLQNLRKKLAANPDTKPLFQSRRTYRYLEAAYETMWKRSCEGLSPETFAVERDDQLCPG